MSTRTRFLLISGMVVFVGSAALTILAQPKPAQRLGTKAGDQAGAGPSGKVAATVNGEPIYESEILAALPDDAFQEQLVLMKKAKLKRLIEEAFQAQFLKDRKVTVSDDEFSKGTKEFEQMVKTRGCACCGGGFESLEQFRKINAFSAWELRLRISGDVGLRLYAERRTKEQASPQALEEAAKKSRPQIEADYVEGYVIAFGDMRAPGYFGTDKAVEARREELANKALQRLKKGDSFEKVAKEMSQDAASAPKGGALGCVRANCLGHEVGKVFAKLEPGIYSAVVKETWGCCIVMRKELTQDDVLSVVKEQAKDSVEDQVYQEFKAARDRAEILYGSPPASAPSSASPGARK